MLRYAERDSFPFKANLMKVDVVQVTLQKITRKAHWWNSRKKILPHFSHYWKDKKEK